jgi:hypothetical protein
VHVERSEPRQAQNALADHIAVVEREEQVRAERTDPFLRRRTEEDGKSRFQGGLRLGVEPDGFLRVVLVGEDPHHVCAETEECFEAAGVPTSL